jgi:predicted nucleotidyltransferase
LKFTDDTRVPVEPYIELRKVLEAFVKSVSAELAENLVGIYLVGSLAVGDFDLDSDVDFLVVTGTDLTVQNTKHLQAIQESIYAMGCYPAQHLEGSYISISDLNDWHTVGKKKLVYFDNGSTEIEKSNHDNQWHVRWILRERGITLKGQKPQEYLQPIPPQELTIEMKAAMLEVMNEFEAEVYNPRCFWNSRFGQPFTVLTFCRMLQTLQTGTVQSKKAAASWAKGVVEPKWVNLIEQAWKEREGVRFMVKIKQRAEQETLDETLAFMIFVVGLVDGMDN